MKWQLRTRVLNEHPSGFVIYASTGREASDIVCIVPRNRPRTQGEAEQIAREIVRVHNATIRE